MKDAHDDDCLAPRLVKDQIILEARNRTGADPDKLAEAALRSKSGVSLISLKVSSAASSNRSAAGRLSRAI